MGRGLQQSGARGALTGGGAVVTLGRLRRRRSLALGLLQDVEALAEAAEGSGRCGFEQQQVLVQAGQGAFGGKGVDGLDQAFLLDFGLGHHLFDLQQSSRILVLNSPSSGRRFVVSDGDDVARRRRVAQVPL